MFCRSEQVCLALRKRKIQKSIEKAKRQRPKLLFCVFLDKSCLRPVEAQLKNVVEYGLLRYSRPLGPFPFVSSFSEENFSTTCGLGGYYGPSAIHFRLVDRSGFHRCCLQFLANFHLRPFCVEMSFSLLSPLIWVICSLVQALYYSPAGFLFPFWSYHNLSMAD